MDQKDASTSCTIDKEDNNNDDDDEDDKQPPVDYNNSTTTQLVLEEQMEQQQKLIDRHLSEWFVVQDEQLRHIKTCIGRELELGLRDEDAATIKMLITYVRDLSRGDEIGSYLALDLGGTHFRVLLVTLTGDGSEPKVVSTMHDIPHEMLVTQNGQELFDYIALKLLEFVQANKLKRRRISLGFTFSFPCKQYGLTQSVLVKWCKGFAVGGVVGTDVVRQLKDALKRQLAGLVEAYIDVVAVINDTTGTLVACANKHRDCRIGLIVGTGFNACYMERLDRCDKWPANYTSPKQVIVNCEWGAMGDNVQRRELDQYRNEFDHLIDRQSVNPRQQTYEKMVAGMYVGELLRLTLLKLYQNKLLFHQQQQATTCKRSRTRRSCVSQQKGGGASTPPPPTISSSNQKQKSISNKSKSTSNKLTTKLSSNTSINSINSMASSNENHKLNVKDILNGKHLSMLAKDELSNSFTETRLVLKELNILDYNEWDMTQVIKCGASITRRAAHLVACGISALLERMQRPFTIIGYDGSLVKHHPYFLKLLVDKTTQLSDANNYKFQFVQSSDGSGIGAAVVAAALHKERRPLYVVKPGKLYEMHFLRQQTQSKLN